MDYDNVAPICSAITPVPGGVGPMTRAMLMLNTLMALKSSLWKLNSCYGVLLHNTR